jgi:hypothetical protein
MSGAPVEFLVGVISEALRSVTPSIGIGAWLFARKSSFLDQLQAMR